MLKQNTPRDIVNMVEENAGNTQIHGYELSQIYKYVVYTDKQFNDVKKLLLKTKDYDDISRLGHLDMLFAHSTYKYINTNFKVCEHYRKKLFCYYDSSVCIKGINTDHQHILFSVISHKVNHKILLNEKKREDLIRTIVSKYLISDLSNIVYEYLPPMLL